MAGYITETERVSEIIRQGAAARMSDTAILELEISRFRASKQRQAMLDSDRYYRGDHDIMSRRRMAIGQGGVLEEVTNLPNNKIVDNQYAKLVDQKVNYLLAKPVTFKADNEGYTAALKDIFNNRFLRMLRTVGADAMKHSISWLYPHYDDTGAFKFKRFPGWEICPVWRDADHTDLEFAIRLYQVEVFNGPNPQVVEKVEVYKPEGIDRYTMTTGGLIPDVESPAAAYATNVDETGKETPYGWLRVPLVPFKYNAEEITLLSRVRSLQDGLNSILSNFQNNMEEDARNTIMVLVNYDGENLGEFRRNLALYGAVKVRSGEGQSGDVKTLAVEVNAENYKAIVELFRKAIIDNGRGYDMSELKSGGTPNEMNIKSIFNDIDMDASAMETEFKASFEDLMFFVNAHLANAGAGNFEKESLEVIFNRDTVVCESQVITDIKASVGILSTETLIEQHPWVHGNAAEEVKRLKAEKQANIEQYGGAFGGKQAGGGVNGQQP